MLQAYDVYKNMDIKLMALSDLAFERQLHQDELRISDDDK